MNEGGGTSSGKDGHLDSSLSEENHEGSNFIKVDIFDKKEGAQVTDINIFSKQAEQSSRVKPQEESALVLDQKPLRKAHQSLDGVAMKKQGQNIYQGLVGTGNQMTKFAQYMQDLNDKSKGKSREKAKNIDLVQVLGLRSNREIGRLAKSTLMRNDSLTKFFGNPYEQFKVNPLEKLIQPNITMIKKPTIILAQTKSTSELKELAPSQTLKVDQASSSSFKNEYLRKSLLTSSGQTSGKTSTHSQRRELENRKVVAPSGNEILNQNIAEKLILQYNAESQKYSSPTVHFQVLLKQALSMAHNSGLHQPCTFVTHICTQIFDHVSSLVPYNYVLDSLLTLLKNTLLCSIYLNFDPNKIVTSDQQNAQSNDKNKLSTNYLQYETYHDRVIQLVKQNKKLRSQIAILSHDRQETNANARIVNNIVDKIKRDRTRRHLVERVFGELKSYAQRKMRQFCQQISSNTQFEVKAAQKQTLKKCYMDWKVYSVEQKVKRQQKEIKYYQGKYEETEALLAQSKIQLRAMNEECEKLKSQLNEKHNRLESKSKELANVKVNTTSKKPPQVRKLLKLYFKYMFTNPFITRVRLQSDFNMPSYRDIKATQGEPEQSKVRVYNLRLLLKKKELLHEGGLGVLTLNNLSLRTLMMRWASFMIERATHKLNKLIEILEKEVKIREFCKAQKKASGDQDLMDDSSGNEEGGEGEERAYSREGKNQCLNLTLSGNTGGLLAKLHTISQPSLPKIQYSPFRSFRKDLVYLQTFKSMISKVLSPSQSLGTNLLDSGVLLAIAFAIDSSERKLLLSNSDYVKRLVYKSGLLRNPTPGGGDKLQRTRMSIMIMPFQIIPTEVTPKEEVIVPEYKSLLLFVHDTNQDKRAQLTMHELERVQRAKIDWYISPVELLSGNEHLYTSLLMFIFYWNSTLEKPSSQTSFMHSTETLKLSPEILKQERTNNGVVLKRVIQAIQSKIQPLISRKVHSNLQDLCLLFKPEELEVVQKGESDYQIRTLSLYNQSMELITKIPSMSREEILLRWANHLLRSYNAALVKHDLEIQIREKFAKQKGQGSGPESPTNIGQGEKLINNRQRMTVAVNPTTIQKVGGALDKQVRGKSVISKRNAKFVKALESGNSSPKQGAAMKLPEGPLDCIDLMTDLQKDNYHRFVIILAFLTPETLWDMQDFDYSEISSCPSSIDQIQKFLETSTLDSRCLFILNAVQRVTKKIHLISMDQLHTGASINFEEILIEMFLRRPYLTNSRPESAFIEAMQSIEDFYHENRLYLNGFDKNTFEVMQEQIEKLKGERDIITKAFAFVQDSERIYQIIKEKLLKHLLDQPNKALFVQRQLALDLKTHHVLNQVESSILEFNKEWLFDLVPTRQPYLNAKWGMKLEQTVAKYLQPLKRWMNMYLDNDGLISYFELWRALKSINIRTFNLEPRDIEILIIKLIRLKERDGRATILGADTAAIEESALDFNEDFELEQDAFQKQLKSELLGGTSDGGKIKIVGSQAKQKGSSLENLGIKTHYYLHRFTPGDLILALIAVLFKVHPTQFIREMIILEPTLKDEGLRNVNRLLSRDKIYAHVETFIADYTPGIAFEQYLVRNVLIQNQATKSHPFILSQLRPDFKAFLHSYLNSLYHIFDFYLSEYSQQYQQPQAYRYLSLQPEAAYLMLQDLDAFNQETGLHRQSFNKIFMTMQQKQVSIAQIEQAQITYENVYNSFFGGIPPPVSGTGKGQEPTNTMVANQSVPPPLLTRQSKSQPSFNRKQMNQATATKQNLSYLSQKLQFKSLTFFDFIEFLYLCAQYHNPDPLVNTNQKFADFLEQTVIVHIQFKAKGKPTEVSAFGQPNVTPPHQERLLKALNSQKIMRGVNLECFNGGTI